MRVLSCLAVLAASAFAELKYGSVATVNGQWAFKNVLDKTAVAFGSFDDSLNSDGWGKLTISTNSYFPDADQFYAAGFLEGALTSNRIFEMSQNMNGYFSMQNPSENITRFFDQQDTWAKQQIISNPDDSFWQSSNFIIQQFEGLIGGYNFTATNPLRRIDFQILNGVGDLLDLISAIDGGDIDWLNVTLPKPEFENRVFARSLCSALIKVTPDLSDLFVAHSSWFTYSAMNRIYKHYEFNVNAPFVNAKKTSFSSYPGFLESLDDFYLMSSGLAMIQTTNNIFDTSLYSLVSPASMLAWQRVRVASLNAASGKEWYELVKQHNSGSYNNQYMIVDYKLFTPGHDLLPNTLWVIEQIPGLVVGADVTSELARGYWPSYNVPYFTEIYEKSGYPQMVEKYGPTQSYQLAPRAQIFRRDQTLAKDLDSLKSLMRSNNFQTDPLSQGNPNNAICARGDLRASGASPNGCYDTKVSNYDLFWKNRDMISHAINGPTLNDASQPLPAFSWNKFPGNVHAGEPQVYDFDFIVMQADQL